MGVLDHLQRGGDLVDVSGHAHHINHALRLGQNVFVVIGALRIRHHRKLEGGWIVADDAAQVVLQAVFPDTVLARDDDLPRGLIAQLHVINPGLHTGGIDGLDDLVVELVVVHQAPVADGAIQHFDLGAVGNPSSRRAFL